ncbi:N-6 DNA methylase, partial [candidate division WOR-3 bacterium]|nr:N-6 DNA methylase [candidate division WOR-3 bacterium]
YPPNASANKFLIEKGARPISSIDSTLNLVEVINSVVGEETIRKAGQKKDLGQYFTPQTVVEFMYDMIKTLWQEEKPKIIDPACGEGIFLKYALEQGITYGDNLYGCDIDAGVREKWNAFGLSNRMKLFIHNGLLDGKELGIKRDKFDLVIGNPPYGGTGLGELAQLLEEDKTKSRKVSSLHLFKKGSEIKKQELVAEKESIYSAPISNERKRELIQLANTLGEFYETWKKGDITEITGTGKQETIAPNLFEGLGNMKPGKKKVDLIVERIQKAKLLGKGKEQLHLSPKELKKLISYPIEVLFLERFLQLAKPGGYVAIIIPDGVLANINLQYVREWIFNQARVFAIVSLPRETFKYIGTTAKTSIIFMQKFIKEQTFETVRNLPIFMASADYVGINHEEKNDLPEISRGFKKFRQGKRIKEGHSSPMVTRATGEDVLKVHRLDPEYWDPKYQKMIRVMKKNHKVKSFEGFISFITYGVILVKKERRFSKRGIKYTSPTTITDTGLDTYKLPLYVKPTDKRNAKNRKPLYGDILFNRSGVGTLGRNIIFIYDSKFYTVSDDVDIIRFEKISPFYTSIFLKSRFGQEQIERLLHGVSGLIKISFEEIKSMQIPILPDIIQKNIEREYKKISKWHNKAMDVKKKLIEGGLSNKEAEKKADYQKNIKKAEAMLEDLIKKTEEIIEGKRKKL